MHFEDSTKIMEIIQCINPLPTGAAYIPIFNFLLAHDVLHFKYVKDKM